MTDIEKYRDLDLWVDPSNTPYVSEARDIQRYAQEHDLPVWKAAKPYLAPYTQQPASYNARVKAIRKILELQLDVITNAAERAARQRTRDELKQIKVQPQAVADRSPTSDQVDQLIATADRRLSLIIEFLWQTGCRISETLDAELRNLKELNGTARLMVVGKGRKGRTVYLSTELARRVRREFAGERRLFEHGGKQYERTATTNRIKQLSLRIFGVPFTAHSIRHAKALDLKTKGFPREKVQALLGHVSAATTDIYYEPEWSQADFETSWARNE